MKLRLVKFLTSHENEIEKKEEGGRSTTIMRSASTQPGRGQSPMLLLPLQPSSLHLSILSSSTILRQQVPSPPHPSCRPPRAVKQLLQLSLLQLFRFSLSSS